MLIKKLFNDFLLKIGYQYRHDRYFDIYLQDMFHFFDGNLVNSDTWTIYAKYRLVKIPRTSTTGDPMH